MVRMTMECAETYDTMASFYPRTCTMTFCECSAPNGFGEDGNRICLTFGPARGETPSSEVDPCEICDFCDAEVPESEMGHHVCEEAVEYLHDAARRYLDFEAGEDSESEGEQTPAVRAQ